MRFRTLLFLSIILLPLALIAAPASANPPGDDLVVCCDAPAAPPTAGQICGLVQSCVPIDGTIASINRCNGIVMGCSESVFLCQPSSVTKGKQDCSCANLARLLPCPSAN